MPLVHCLGALEMLTMLQYQSGAFLSRRKCLSALSKTKHTGLSKIQCGFFLVNLLLLLGEVLADKRMFYDLCLPNTSS